MCFNFVLDRFEEELYCAKERIMQISFEKDELFDSVEDLKRKLIDCRFEKKALQKQYNHLLKVHSNCRSKNVILYR